MTHVAVVGAPLDLAALVARVASSRHGAVVTFTGAVREEGDGADRVIALEYEAYESMAHDELGRIAREAEALAGAAVAVEHRTGRVSAGEASIVIAVAHGHRAEAFDACRYVIEEVKHRLPIWKRDVRADGSGDWIDARIIRRSDATA